MAHAHCRVLLPIKSESLSLQENDGREVGTLCETSQTEKEERHMFSLVCGGRDRRKEGTEMEEIGNLLQDRREVLAARPHHIYTQEGRRREQ